jgi:phenylalanyl-tRNA synthetase beta chain
VLIQFQEKVTQTFGRQRKKIAIGVYDLDQISGDIDYTAELKAQLSFVPLNSTQAMTARQILQDHPSGKLYGHTLPESDLVQCCRTPAVRFYPCRPSSTPLALAKSPPTAAIYLLMSPASCPKR